MSLLGVSDCFEVYTKRHSTPRGGLFASSKPPLSSAPSILGLSPPPPPPNQRRRISSPSNVGRSLQISCAPSRLLRGVSAQQPMMPSNKLMGNIIQGRARHGGDESPTNAVDPDVVMAVFSKLGALDCNTMDAWARSYYSFVLFRSMEDDAKAHLGGRNDGPGAVGGVGLHERSLRLDGGSSLFVPKGICLMGTKRRPPQVMFSGFITP